MATQSKTDLETTLSTNLANNTTAAITPTLHRAVITNVIDSLFGYAHTDIINTDSPYTLDIDATTVLLADPTSGAITVNLPAVASSSQRWVLVMNVGTTNALTLDGNASETINGATTFVMSTQYDWALLYCDGSAWYSFD